MIIVEISSKYSTTKKCTHLTSNEIAVGIDGRVCVKLKSAASACNCRSTTKLAPFLPLIIASIAYFTMQKSPSGGYFKCLPVSIIRWVLLDCHEFIPDATIPLPDALSDEYNV